MPMVYSRIANPYMPNGTTPFTNAPSPYYAPGEIGCVFSDQNSGGVYLRAQLDSGATSATAVGAVVAGQPAFWKNRATGTVTNDKNQCDLGPSGAINSVAGIFQLAVTAAPGVNGSDGNPLLYMCDLVLQKNNFPVQVTGSPVPGGSASADSTANVARAINTAVGTAVPSQQIGVWTSATTTNNTCPCDVSIDFID